MAETTDLTAQLEAIIKHLDGEKNGVAIAHLRDAIDAMKAVDAGGVTKFALHERLSQGQVVRPDMRRKIR
ncbi:MAG: hypothetical protein AAFN94_01240 [Pseudomonadota bacterium]